MPEIFSRPCRFQIVARNPRASSGKECFVNNSIIVDQFAFQRQYLSWLVDDVAEEQMTAQPGGVVNHPAWQLGHLAYTTDRFATMFGGTQTLEPFKGKFGGGSVPVADRSAYPAKAELLRILDDRRTALVKAFANASPDELAKPNPNAMIGALLPTKGHMILFGMLFHEGTHLGQLATWRKVAGLPQALSKMRR